MKDTKLIAPQEALATEKKKRVVRKKVTPHNTPLDEHNLMSISQTVTHKNAPSKQQKEPHPKKNTRKESITTHKEIVVQHTINNTNNANGPENQQAFGQNFQQNQSVHNQNQIPQQNDQPQPQQNQPHNNQSNQHRNNNQHYSQKHNSDHRNPNNRNYQPDNYNNNNQPHHNQKNHDQGPRTLTREQLEECSVQELNVHARRWGVIGASLMLHRELIERIIDQQLNPDREIEVNGVLEKLPDGFGFLRSAKFDYVSSPDDVYVSPSQIRRFGLRTGDTVLGAIRKPKENEKYFALLKVDKVNFEDPIRLNERPTFDRLSPMHPNKKFTLEFSPMGISTRLMDMFTPIGRGQRGLIVAPPKAGKTMLLKEIAQSLIANHPDVYLMVLLIDERPEEVADMRRCIKGAHAEIISSTFDESAERHVQVAEIVLEKAKRLVESGKDIVILLDAITRLARAYNTIAPASGKVLTGGIDANALQRPKRFFGAARSMEEGGSLTIIATALIETGSRMDEVIYEEFKGTGNMEMHLSRKLANRRIYPAYDLLVSSTRREDLLFNEEEQKRAWVLQKFLGNMNLNEGMEFMIDKMKKFKTNEEFFESINKKGAAPTNSGSSNGNGNSNGSDRSDKSDRDR